MVALAIVGELHEAEEVASIMDSLAITDVESSIMAADEGAAMGGLTKH